MGYYNWIEEFNNQALEKGDVERLRLGFYAMHAWDVHDIDPDLALSLAEHGHALATRLHEPWWMLFYDHLKLQTLIWRKRDYHAALKLAVRCAVESRKPQYAQCPQRVALQIDLIGVYVGIDPMGYADQIKSAILHMQQEADDFYTRCALQEVQADFAFEVGDMAGALEAALGYLSLAETGDSDHSRDHYRSNAFYRLSRVAYRQGLWDELRQWSETGEEIAGRIHNALHLIELTMWLALARRQSHDQKAAARLYRKAMSLYDRLGATPWVGFFDAWAAYHELDGDREQALQVRVQELEALEGKGQILTECRCRIQRCRLLQKMGQPVDTELTAAREVAHKLRHPENVLAELNKITA